ncbi:hypothetical protein SDC9_08965 [bioreactor metagenome]|uniref:Uncharacterized protein n=1 Tax=bioreactor metagenome TaxID=1076179 RepID=A0A644T974_9ZZZZ|nr:hypothetical protein [Negativicutes bacterium]
MDLIITLIIMAALYFIPEVLRRKKPQEYKYPEIPDTQSLPKPVSLPTMKKAPHYKPKEVVIPSNFNSSTHPLLEKGGHHETLPSLPIASIEKNRTSPNIQFDQTAVLNGVIWAEVLLPPRAHRPLEMVKPPQK